MLEIAVALAAATTATKIATGWWAARRRGAGTLGRFRAGSALVARGEFSIVIAGLAVGSGTVDPGIAPLVATYVLLMGILGPVAARVVEPVVRGTVLRRRVRTTVPAPPGGR